MFGLVALPRVLLVDAAALALSAWLEPVLLTLARQTQEGLPGAQVMQAGVFHPGPSMRRRSAQHPIGPADQS
jgi:hypothetical protein